MTRSDYYKALMTESALAAVGKNFPGTRILADGGIHAIELHDLSPDVRQAFTEDIADAGRAIARVLNPIKMNLELLGNVVPHLHCHLKPRYPHDRPGHARIFQDARRQEISLVDLESLAAKLLGQLQE